MVDALTTCITLTPLVPAAERTTRSSSYMPRQAAAAAAFAAKLPQLAALRLDHFVADQLRTWLAGPFGSCTAFTRIKQLRLTSNSYSEADARQLLALLPALEGAVFDGQPPGKGLVDALAQHCPRLQSLELAFDDDSSAVREVVLGLPTQLRELDVGVSRLGERRWEWHSVQGPLAPLTAQLGDLSGLAGLEMLQWGLPWWWGHLDDLPSSLTHLTLAYGSWNEVVRPDAYQVSPATFGLLTRLFMPRSDLDAWVWVHILAHMPSLQIALFRELSIGPDDLLDDPSGSADPSDSGVDSDGHPGSVQLPALPSLRELHLEYIAHIDMRPSEAGAAPAALQLLQRVRAAAPALRLIHVAVFKLQANSETLPQDALALPAVLGALAAVAEGHPIRGPALHVEPCSSPLLGCSLPDVLEAIGEPLHAFHALVVHNIPLGPVERLEGLLRTVLPNVERFTLSPEGEVQPAQLAQLQALARGLPKLNSVTIIGSGVVSQATLQAFACTLSDQRQRGGSTSGGTNGVPNVLVKVHVHGSNGEVRPLGQQRAQHPGVEVVQVWEHQ